MGFVQLNPPRCQFWKSLEGRQENWDRKKLVWTEISEKYLGLVGFTSFYQCFIQSFNKLAKPLISMLITTPTQLAQNLPLDMAEDIEVGSKTSSITRSAKNLPSDMAEDAELGGNGNGGDDETVQRSPFRKWSRPTKYLTSLRSHADSSSFKKKSAHQRIITIVKASN